jgi:hypothetical protein
VADLMSVDELSKIRASLLQAKQLANEEQKKTAAATLAKQLAGVATADKATAAVAEGEVVAAAAGTATAVEAKPLCDPGAAEPAKREIEGASGGVTAEGEAVKAEGAAEGQGEDAMDIDAPQAAVPGVAVGVSDEEIKAFWLSGVAAVVEVSEQRPPAGFLGSKF